MKKILFVLVLMGVLGVSSLFAVKTFAVIYSDGTRCDSPDNDNTFFPYGFLCGSSNNARQNTYIEVEGAGKGGTFDNPIEISPTDSVNISLGYHADGVPRNTQDGSKAQVLVWAYVLAANNSLFANGYNTNSLTNISGGGSPGYCPGQGSNGSGVIYNYNGPDPDKSPAAYTGSVGYEDCGDHGLMAYWLLNDGGPGDKGFNFTVRLDRSSSQPFCIRENISVSYPGNTGVFGGGNSIASHVAKQSDISCYKMINRTPEGDINATTCFVMSVRAYDRSPTRATQFYVTRTNSSGSGTSNVLGSRSSPITAPDANYHNYDLVPDLTYPYSVYNPIEFNLWALDKDTATWHQVDKQSFTGDCSDSFPTFSMSADCNNIYITDLRDNDARSSGIRYGGLIYQRWSDGGTGPLAGSVEGRGSGTFAVPYHATEDPYNEGWVIQIGVYNVTTGGQDGWYGNVHTIGVPKCYMAHCTALSVDGPLSGTTNGVKAGKDFTISATFHNDQPYNTADTLPASITGPFDAAYNLGATLSSSYFGTAHSVYGADVPKQQDFTIKMTLRAPDDVRRGLTFNIYADYIGLFGIDSSPCTGSVNTYKRFTLPVNASSSLDYDENPTAISYKTTVTDTAAVAIGGGAPATAAPITSEVYIIRYGSGARINIVGATSNSGPHNPGNNTLIQENDRALDDPGQRRVNPGDQYCARIEANSFNQGWYGLDREVVGASKNDTDDETGAALRHIDTNCDMVTNKPYYKVYNSGLKAGGGFAPTCTATNGTIGGWNNNSGTNPNYNFGASSQLHAIALSKIVGLATARTNTDGRANYDLTFANTELPGGASPQASAGDSPFKGGSFQGGPSSTCLTKLQPSAGTPVITSALHTIGTTNVSPGTNTEVFVNGNVYISGTGIRYTEVGWSINPDSTTNIPSFKVIATGNIYVDPSVTQLDGIYQAGGQIYTCAIGSTPVAKASLYTSCGNQLTVHGSFIASKVNLMRTYGTLSDEQPIESVAGADGSAAKPLNQFYANDSDGRSYYKFAVNTNTSPGMTLGTQAGYIIPPETGGVPYVPNTSKGEVPLYSVEGITVKDNFYTTDYSKAIDALTHGYAGLNILGYVQSSPKPNTLPLKRWIWNGSGVNLYTVSDTDYSKKAKYAGIEGYVYETAGAGVSGYTARVASPCNTYNGAGIRSFTRVNTCAAEVFDFSPEMYLSRNPGTNPSECCSIHYDANASLPPIL